jgi:tetratricopeptide (TPR) repeat protein
VLALESLGAYPLTISFGDHGDRVTPVPIPNTEVKPVSADGTWGEIPWESRTSPDFLIKRRWAFCPASLVVFRPISVVQRCFGRSLVRVPAPEPRRNSSGRTGSGGARQGPPRSNGGRTGGSRPGRSDGRSDGRGGRSDRPASGSRGGQRGSGSSTGSRGGPDARRSRWSDSDGRSDARGSDGRRPGGRSDSGAPGTRRQGGPGARRTGPGRSGPARTGNSRGPGRGNDRGFSRNDRDGDDRRPYRRDDERGTARRGDRRNDDRRGDDRRRDDRRPGARNFRRDDSERRSGGYRGGRDTGGRGFGRPPRPEWQEKAREDNRETREEREAREPRNTAERRAAEVRSRGGGSARLGQFPAEREEHIDQWIDEGPVREEVEQVVQRARPARANNFELDGDVRDRVNAAVSSPQRAAKLRERLLGAFVSLERERYTEARRIGNQLAREMSGVAAVHELIGLSNYRLGEWRKAAAALERAQTLHPDPDTMPILMDSLRALGRHGDVVAVWKELRQASPSHETMAEGRIIMAGSFADQGDFAAAIKELQPARSKPKRVRDHHLRQWYVLADLLDRAGDTVGAVRFFESIAKVDVDYVDVRQRLRTLGR